LGIRVDCRALRPLTAAGGLETELAAAPIPAPRLHPNLAEVYREKIAKLADVLARTRQQRVRRCVLWSKRLC
jgi:hypothetical protein